MAALGEIIKRTLEYTSNKSMGNFPRCTFTSNDTWVLRWRKKMAREGNEVAGGGDWVLQHRQLLMFELFITQVARAAPRGMELGGKLDWVGPVRGVWQGGSPDACHMTPINRFNCSLTDAVTWALQLTGWLAGWLAGREANVQCQYNEKMPIPKWMCKWNGYKARSQLTHIPRPECVWAPLKRK